MKYLTLVAISVLLFACGQEENPQTQIISDSLSVYSADERIDRDSYQDFLSQMVKRQDISVSVIARHTFLAKPRGIFYGKDQYIVHDKIQAFILHQQTSDSRRDYLITTDGQKTLDQKLITESYQMTDMQLSASYQIDHQGNILCTSRQFQAGVARDAIVVQYSILPSGEIVRTGV